MNTITVASNLTLADRIAAGKYDGRIDLSITEGNFPHDPSTVGEWEWKVFSFGRSMHPREVVTAITANGWQVAMLEHMLAFGEKYPDEPQQNSVIGLGSTCVIDGCRDVPFIWRWRKERKKDLGLGTWDATLVGYACFLAVRRVA